MNLIERIKTKIMLVSHEKKPDVITLSVESVKNLLDAIEELQETLEFIKDRSEEKFILRRIGDHQTNVEELLK